MDLLLDNEQIEQLKRMILSKDKDNLKVAMTIIFNTDDSKKEIVDKKVELYQIIIDTYSWGEFMTLYKENLKLYEKAFNEEFLQTLE